MQKKLNYFGVASLLAQDALFKKHPSSAASVGDEGQAHQAASAVADNVDDDDDWGLGGVVRLDGVERVGAKLHLCDFQDSCRAKKHTVPGTVALAFDFCMELFDQEASADEGSSVELTSVKDALATAQFAAKEAQKQSASLQKKHDTLESGLLAGFNKL